MADEYKEYEVPFKIEGYVIISAKSLGDAVEEVSSNFNAKDLVTQGYSFDTVIAPGHREVKVVE